MAITSPGKHEIQYPFSPKYVLVLKDWYDDVTDTLNTAVADGAGFLTADADGRAVMAAGYFDEATATDKFAAQAITGALIKNLGVGTAQIAAGAVTEPKMAASILTGKHVAVGAPGATVAIVDGVIIITVADGNTVLDAVTLDATYGKIEIDDVWFKKGATTGGTTDAVQLCTDSGGTTAITSSLALNTVAEGGIVRTTSLLNTAVAAGAHLYVKRTKTTNNSGTLYIKCHRVA